MTNPNLNHFILTDEGHHYVGILNNSDLAIEECVNAFMDLLEDFPDPVVQWLDERGPDMLNGPGAWSAEIQQDQETTFIFNVSTMNPEYVGRLCTELEHVVTEDNENRTFNEADCSRIWQASVTFSPMTDDVPILIYYCVYWKLVE